VLSQIFAYALTRTILVAAVLMVMLMAMNGLYVLAGGLALALAAYGYLTLWGDVRIEDVL
jgi:hypothetical protein